ncbi:hypothetical protein ACHAXR_006498 [Thalassiosira sp. AJA248-18]
MPRKLSAAAFICSPPPPTTLRCSSRSHDTTISGHIFLSSNNADDNIMCHEFECDDDIAESQEQSSIQTSLPSANTRRQFFQQQILAATFYPTISQASTIDNGYFSLKNNNNVPYIQRQELVAQQKMQQKERADKRKRNAFKIKKFEPFVNVKKWNSVETCLLEMLPVRNPVFRQLQELIEDLEVLPTGDSEGWKQTLLDSLAILNLLDSKRSILEPVFNQEDPTELYISKSSLGERNIENLRSKLEALIRIASGKIDFDVNDGGRRTVNSGAGKANSRRRRTRNQKDTNIDDNIDILMEDAGDIDVDAFIEAKREALFVLSELGELLVPSFPYAVPTSGKFGYLPRLLGRCSVTISFERPSSTSSAFGVNLGAIAGNDKQFLGNVTIIADGYAAPITAGNFVDLCERNFYTGLNVKAMRKRLGLVPTMSDNVIVNDLTELKDNFDGLKDSAFELPDTLNKAKGGSGRGDARGIFRSNKKDDPFEESLYDESRMTMDAILPILGSFQEGFYDPLTAKPRRIPLEVVALDGTSPTKSTLTYSSSYASLDDDMSNAGTTTYSALTSSSSAQRSFSSATSSSSSNSTATAYSSLDPVLSFNIPNLVALNHPDRASNGGSSEFFALPRRDLASKRSKLLDGQYAPFGYIVSGSDVYQSLRPGDVIGATYVSQVGLLNLVKIRKNAFEGGGEEDAPVEENIDEGS